jgi:hypothetical protein
VVVEIERGQDQDARAVGVGRCQLPSGLDAVHARHPDVHQHDVRLQPAADPHGLRAVGGLAEYVEAGLAGEQRGEPVAHHLLVVGDDDPDRHARS